MQMRKLLAAILLPSAHAVTMELTAGANPIRKVVTLLQKMQKKVGEEVATADDLYSKYMCYCKSNGEELAASIEAAEAKLPEDAASIKASTSQKEQLESDLDSHQKDRRAAKKAIAEATALREKENAAYEKALGDEKQNLAALNKAVAALSKGMEGSFVQLPAAQVLRKFVTAKQEMSEDDRHDILSFLSGQDGGKYAPSSGEIVGLLNQLGDEMQADIAELISTEEAAVKSYEELTAAKKKEIAALSASIQSKMTRVGQLGVEIATLKNDAEDTAEGLEQNTAFVADLTANCGKRGEIHEREKQMRAQEVVALADTIKMLNDDDALDLFKKTLPSASASFFQVQESSAARLAEAADVVAAARRHAESSGRPHLDFIMLALRGKKAGFGHIVKLIDVLVASLKTEQTDDDDKKTYCGAQLDQTEDTITGLKNTIADEKTGIEEAKDRRDKLGEEIAKLKAGIVALDSAVAEATANRKAESAAHKELVRTDSAAKELLLFAKNRLNKFYNPKLYKTPAKRELSEGDQIYENEGGSIPTEAPGGIANTGIEAFVQLESKRQAPPPPPATKEAYTKKAGEAGGVLSMIDLLVKDLDKELTVSNTEEENDQSEYEQMTTDSAEKRRRDSKELTDKESAKADVDEFLEEAAASVKGNQRKLQGADKYLGSLHGECDWLLNYFDVRKQARADEVDSLDKAKAVLNGADYSLVQQGSTSRRLVKLSPEEARKRKE